MKRWLPLIIFAVLVGFFAKGLFLNPREVPSPFIGKPAPLFTTAVVCQPSKPFSTADMKGKVWLLNVWSTWCPSCESEHQLLVELSRKTTAPIVGLVYKELRGDYNIDKSKLKDMAPGEESALACQRVTDRLQQLGNPYALSVLDNEGKIGIDYGVYGVPETFIIDKNGVIRFKQPGVITEKSMQEVILPKLKELGA
jgi:cytochrome c biogenesis protein CcmG/thiol:disulfide interchange protein DsbE